MELKSFPLDMQSLHIQIGSSWDCKSALFSFNTDLGCAMDPNALDSAEWVLHSPRLIAFDMGWSTKDLPLLSQSTQSITGARYSRAYIALTTSRKPMYYIWNVFLMVFILGTLSFTIFSVDVNEPADRLSNMLTLVLALVAFKLVLSQSLPAISYLTILDVYTFASLSVMFFISVGAAALPNPNLGEDELRDADRTLCALAAFLWILVNVMFLSKLWLQWNRRTAELKQIDQRFSDYKNSLTTKSVAHGYKPLGKGFAEAEERELMGRCSRVLAARGKVQDS
eukprot:3721956-Pyramimonas_sp.AAC.1